MAKPADGTLKQSMNLKINGHARTLELPVDATLDRLVAALDLKGDRIAVEHNGEIVQRTQWAVTPVAEGDRFEIVHFVGGGAPWAL
jgi:thiamine biosynthesis protein ThiS